MLKNIARLESIVNGKVGHFLLENDTPIDSIKEMLFQFMSYVGHLEQQHKAQLESQKAQEDQQKDQEETSKIVPIEEEKPAECSACI